MQAKSNKNITVPLSIFGLVFSIMPFISSCGKGTNVGPSLLNVRYQIVNLSPDLNSVDLYVHYIKVNTSSYFYPTASGYFALPSIDTPFQIRPGTTLVAGTTAPSYNIFNIDSLLKPNMKYSLMILGFKNQTTDPLSYIMTTDTSALPSLGHGKVRFINGSPLTPLGLNVTANDTSLFTGALFKQVSAYKELPAGTYEFKIYTKGSTNILRDVPNVTIQDGRAYTLYTYGLTGHSDSMAFGSGFITNY